MSDYTGNTKLDRAAAAIAAGEWWRAKEILRGRIRSKPFDAALYERYGQVLLRSGDDLEAGKFLLLSGKREPEYRAAIEVFVRRYSRGRWQDMFATFPRSTRRSPWSALPPQARADLIALGVPDRPDEEPVSWSGKVGSSAPTLGCRGAFVLLLVLSLTGLVLAGFIAYFGYTQ